MPARIERNVAIARSGIYTYLKQEISGFKLPAIPDKYKNLEKFNVYRPALVLSKNKDKFTKAPIIHDHKGEVTPDNFRDWALGWVGDSASIEYQEDTGEVVIMSTANLLDSEALQLYKNEIKEVSPWYDANFSWQDGISPDGTPFQIVMDSVNSVNHLAIVSAGRGGPSVAIDKKPEENSGLTIFDLVQMKKIIEKSKNSGLSVVKDFFSNLFTTKDHDLGSFRKEIMDIVKRRNEFTDYELKAEIGELRGYIGKLKPSNDVQKLARFIDDFECLREINDEGLIEQSAKEMADLFERLDTDTMATEEETKEEVEMAGKAKDNKMKDAEAMAPEKKEYLMREWESFMEHHKENDGNMKDWEPGVFGEEKEAKDEDMEEESEKKEETSKEKAKDKAKDKSKDKMKDEDSEEKEKESEKSEKKEDMKDDDEEEKEAEKEKKEAKDSLYNMQTSDSSGSGRKSGLDDLFNSMKFGRAKNAK